MKHILKTNDFYLSMSLSVCETDINLPVNTVMQVLVQSDGFTANTTMEIDIKSLVKFSSDLQGLYERLSGEAIIQEPYGMNTYLSFKGNGSGYIFIKGYLSKNIGEKKQSMEFECSLDQTFLAGFCSGLVKSCEKYKCYVLKNY